MKRIVFITSVFILVSCFFGCASKYETTTDDEPVTAANTAIAENEVTNSDEDTANATVELSDSVETHIKDAIQNGTSYHFELLNNHQFSSNLEGIITTKDDNGVKQSQKDDNWVRGSLKEHSAGFVVCIDNGNVTMQDNTNYACDINISEGNPGVNIRIYHINSDNIEGEIIGTIKGNTLSASQTHNSTFWFAATDSGTGYYFSGDYDVSLMEVPESQWKPLAVKLDSIRNNDNSITLTWVDSNPSGVVAYYEIYRVVGVSNNYTLVATISDKSSWTDSTKDAKDIWNLLTYYVVAYNKSGVASEISNYIFY